MMSVTSQKKLFGFVITVLFFGLWIWRAYSWVSWLGIVAGSVIGFFLDQVEVFINEQLSKRSPHAQNVPLVSRSPLFLGALIPISLLVVSSTPHVLGKAVVVGFLFRLLKEVFIDNELFTEGGRWEQVVVRLTTSERQWLQVLVLIWSFLCVFWAVLAS